MGVYNCSQTIDEAIGSILKQTYSDWEFIICDDFSTDNTYNKLLYYKENYPDKFVLLKNKKNFKLAYTLNRCLKYAKGRYIARMDGDDISLPERFEKQIKFLNNNPDMDLVGTSMRRFDDNGLADVLEAAKNPNKYTRRNRLPFYHATIMTYKYVYQELNGYTVSNRTIRVEDSDLWYRFYNAGFKGNNILEPLYLVREDINSIKRRTFKVRWTGFRSTVRGYKLLGFPSYWLIRPFIKTLVKGLIPGWLVIKYRAMQKKNRG